MFILLNYIAINAQSINESFTLRVVPDKIWALKFYNSKQYEYYSYNFIGGGPQILEKGTYKKTKNKIVLTTQEKKNQEDDIIPKVLYYSRMSKKEFEKLESKPFSYDVKNYMLWKRYHVLKLEP